MNRDFTNYKEAQQYVKEMREQGHKAYIEEFYGFDGRFFTVLVDVKERW